MFWMQKKVFDPKKHEKKQWQFNLNIENWNTNIDNQNRALKVSFDIENLIFSNIPNAKEGKWKTVTVRISKAEMRILKWYFDIRNCAFKTGSFYTVCRKNVFKVSFDIENMIFGNIQNARVGFWL